jgi:hypothetical protein
MDDKKKDIQNWVSLDNQIKILNEKLRELREEKNSLSDKLMNDFELNTTIQISDGRIKFTKTKITSPITLKYVDKCLNEVISNKDQVDKILEYIKQKREIEYVNEIKRFTINN